MSNQDDPAADRALRSEAPCPCCGAPVAYHEFTTGSAAFWCRRCSWSLIEDPDGEVERETTPDPEYLSWPPLSGVPKARAS